MSEPPVWYAGGLSFACTKCGNCCTGSPGYVWVSPEEIRALAQHVGMEEKPFRRRYTRMVHGVISLIEKPTGECIFLSEERRCTVNAIKPRQCLAFPFWPRLLERREFWQAEAESCPGMGTGPRFTKEEIERAVDRETPREELCRILAKPSE